MKDRIDARFTELLTRGKELVVKIGTFESDGEIYPNQYPDYNAIETYQAWLSSTAHLIQTVCRKGSYFNEEVDNLIRQKDPSHAVPTSTFQRLLGLLVSAHEEWTKGMLREIEYIFVAGTFDDFLDHADNFHKANKKTEAAVLVSAVLEDAVKKIAVKNSIDSSGKSLEPLIDELAKKGIFTPVKAKRVKSYSGIRNYALHAEWDKFDIKDVGEAIHGTRELVEEFVQ